MIRSPSLREHQWKINPWDLHSLSVAHHEAEPIPSNREVLGEIWSRARLSENGLLARGSGLVDRRPRDREDLPHIFSERLAKALGIGRHRAPLVPLNSIPLSNRLAPVGYADDSQCMAIGSQDRRNDRHPLAELGKREQGMRRAALEDNVWLDVCETAGCVEQSPNRITRVQ